MSRITVAQRVRQLREMRGIKLEQLARLTEVEPSTLSRYETGDIRNPSVTILQKICNAVDITLPEFFLGLEEVTYQCGCVSRGLFGCVTFLPYFKPNSVTHQ